MTLDAVFRVPTELGMFIIQVDFETVKTSRLMVTMGTPMGLLASMSQDMSREVSVYLKPFTAVRAKVDIISVRVMLATTTLVIISSNIVSIIKCFVRFVGGGDDGAV